jgi:hypothetical protein
VQLVIAERETDVLDAGRTRAELCAVERALEGRRLVGREGEAGVRAGRLALRA